MANLGFQGYVNFGNDTNNALDTGFGFANAATGVFTQYLQQSKLIEGSMIYNNTEFYVQDNWKVNNRLTLDYGVRFTRQQPQYDQFLQMSNFFPNEWSLANAPLLYVSGCNNGATVCSGNARNAVDPRTGQILTAPGAANTAAAIGTVDPRHRQPDQRHPSGRARHRGHLLRLAEPGVGAAFRHGVRPDRRSDASCCAPAADCSTTVRTATPSSRFPATRRSPRRRICAMASCRRSAPVSARLASRR